MEMKSLVYVTLIFLINLNSGSTITGLSVFGTVFGFFTFGWDIFDNNNADEKFGQMIKKLNSLETEQKKLSLTVQYNEPEMNILIAYDKLQKIIKATDNTTALRYPNEFNNYMKYHYAAGGTKMYYGVFRSDRLFGSSMFKEPPENLKVCYEFHTEIMLLLSKAGTVELAYVYGVRNKLSRKAKMETWKNRIMKLQDSKETLCDTFNMCEKCDKASKSNEKWKIYFIATIVLIGVLGIVLLAIVVCCCCFCCCD